MWEYKQAKWILNKLLYLNWVKKKKKFESLDWKLEIQKCKNLATIYIVIDIAYHHGRNLLPSNKWVSFGI